MIRPIDLLGVWRTQADIGAALGGLRQSSVAEWFQNEVIPPPRQYQLWFVAEKLKTGVLPLPCDETSPPVIRRSKSKAARESEDESAMQGR